ncbi:MAG: hypothetical protein OEV14_11470 [Gammaproteobacteria bacterium]|jgi:DNA-binding NarL/FixJ family response regulator|nr:hypothetical protein [Gammaproteobacteria bacterium]
MKVLIAGDLGIEETTVKAHVSAALVSRELEIQDSDQLTPD